MNPTYTHVTEQHSIAAGVPVVMIDADGGLYRRAFEHPNDRPAGEDPFNPDDF